MYSYVKGTKRRRNVRPVLVVTETVLALLLAVLVWFAVPEGKGAEKPVMVRYHGREYAAVSSGTVGELLEGLGLEIGEADVLSVPRGAAAEPGMVIHVDAVCHRQEEYTVVLPAGTVYCRDLSLPKGTEKVLYAGSDGELRCVADVCYVNGIESGRMIRSRELLSEPEDRIIAQGESTEERQAEIRNGSIHLPDGQVLTYTHAAAVRASAYPREGARKTLTLADGGSVPIGLLAADPSYIPPGTRLFLTSEDGSVSYGIVTTIENGMQSDRAELYLTTMPECMAFGEQRCTVYFLG